ncbi:TetR/AcrR family transcriptional regulator [Rhizobium sp. 21-4511-3d]
MKERNDTRSRRQRSLTREQIIDASIRLLDEGGEGGLTFQALSKLLATGPGAIYWHVADKSDLVTAACDEIIARTMEAKQAGASPQETIRALALDLFDAIDAHPWVGAALMSAPGQLPMVRIFERIGQQVRSLGVSAEHEWSAVSALLNYILGVAGQNAANAKLAAVQGLERASFLGEVSAAWSALDPESYPFTRSVAAQLPAHDDRKDYLDGIDLLLRGIVASS